MLNAWQIEIMEQDARNRMWEDMNEPEPKPYQEAMGYVRAAIESLNKACDKVSDAESILCGTDEGNKLVSFSESIAEIIFGMNKLADVR